MSVQGAVGVVFLYASSRGGVVAAYGEAYGTAVGQYGLALYEAFSERAASDDERAVVVLQGTGEDL